MKKIEKLGIIIDAITGEKYLVQDQVEVAQKINEIIDKVNELSRLKGGEL